MILKLLEILLAWIPFDWIATRLEKKKEHPVFLFFKSWYSIHPPDIWIRNPAKRFLAHVHYQSETEIVMNFLKTLKKETKLNDGLIYELIDRIEVSSLLLWRKVDIKNDAMTVFITKLDLRHRSSTKKIIEKINIINTQDISDSERLSKYLDVFHFEMIDVFYGISKFMDELNGELQKHLDKLDKIIYT